VLPDADVAARHRLAMLARPMRNILECSPGAMDGACRMGLSRRFKVLGQKGATLWMTGLSGAGKTTITKALEKRLLLAMRKNVYNIDGDNLRTGLTRDLGFSASDRAESVRRASEVAQLFSEAVHNQLWLKRPAPY
jgi:adenylylsulfate kinase-like enzyme